MIQRSRSLAVWLLLPLGAAAAVGLAWEVGPHLTQTKLFPEAVAALAGLLALTWATIVLDPAWILSGGLALTIFSGDWHYLHIPGPVDRVVLLAGLVSAVWRSMHDPDVPRIEVRRVHWLMGLLLVYGVASAIWSKTLINHTFGYELLDRLGIFPFILYLVGPSAFATEKQRTILLTTLVVIGAYLGLTAVFEIYGPKRLVFPSFIADPALGLHEGRARGPFLEAGADGLAMFTSAVAAAMLQARVRDRRVRAGLALVILLCIVGIVLTLTRQVWAGAVAGAALASCASPSLRRRLPVAIVALVVLIGGAYVAIPAFHQKIQSRASDQSSVWDRLNSDAAALRMFETRPLLGYGWGTFSRVSPDFYHLARNYPLSSVAEVHNVVLSNAAELGAVGTVLWLLCIAGAVLAPFQRRGPPELRNWRLGMIALVVAWFVQLNFAPLSYAFDNYMPWLFAGIAIGPAMAAGPSARAARDSFWFEDREPAAAAG